MRAVLHDRDAVGKLEDLVEAVRNVDHAGAARPQFADDGKQPLGIAVCKNRSRLVEDDDARVVGKRLGDLDDLLVGDRKPPGLNGGVDREAETAEDFARRLAQPAVVDDARQTPQKDILGNRQIGRQSQFLMDQRNASARRIPRTGELHCPAVEPDRAGGRCRLAAEHAHQRGFARAIFSDQRMHFAGLQIEVHALQGLDAGIILPDTG